MEKVKRHGLLKTGKRKSRHIESHGSQGKRNKALLLDKRCSFHSHKHKSPPFHVEHPCQCHVSATRSSCTSGQCDCHSFSHFMPHPDHFRFQQDGFFVKNNCCLPISSRFICDERIQLRLAGLNGNLNFQLFRFQGCPVKIEFSNGGNEHHIKGIICNVGTNFVDILKDDQTVVTILQERINNIHWLDPTCNPCHFPCFSDDEKCLEKDDLHLLDDDVIDEVIEDVHFEEF